MFWVCPEVFPLWDAQRKALCRRPNRMPEPPHLEWFCCGEAAALLQATHLHPHTEDNTILST